jgi:phosphatidylserine/phosphatidylglycerophosphate/cardiolipin synthase-like enzyme
VVLTRQPAIGIFTQPIWISSWRFNSIWRVVPATTKNGWWIMTMPSAIGFVMGHNMLDEYWDTEAHSPRHTDPRQGRNGIIGPREDFSALVSGKVLGDLFFNFNKAWQQETGSDLPRQPVALAASAATAGLPIHRPCCNCCAPSRNTSAKTSCAPIFRW